jgi:adenylyltransferase/sulfurtransferase
VLGVLPGLVALIQATETIKLVTGVGEPLYGRLLQVDALRMEFTEFRVRKDPACPVCGESPSVTKLIDYEGFCGLPARRVEAPPEISAAAVAARLAGGERVLVLDVREAAELDEARIGGTHWIPLKELPARVEELADWRRRPVVVHCHHGGRSARACELLRASGFADVSNLAGGIEAWSLTVDPSVARY